MMATISVELQWTEDFPMVDKCTSFLSLLVSAAEEMRNKKVFEREQDMSLKDEITNAILKKIRKESPGKHFENVSR